METKRKMAGLYVPAWMIALLLLYLALPGVPPSVAELRLAGLALEAVQPASRAEVAAAYQVLAQRLASEASDASGAGGPVLALQGDRIGVSLPPGGESLAILAEASRIGRVELVDGGTEFLAIGSLVQTGLQAIPDQATYQSVLTNADFVAAEARLGTKGRPVIDFTLTPAADARLAAQTADRRGYYLCLAVDRRIVNCPILRTPLTERRGVIELTGSATLADARTLAMLLRSGPLPVAFKLAAE
jgi:preprotein translocase subunit SecD